MPFLGDLDRLVMYIVVHYISFPGNLILDIVFVEFVSLYLELKKEKPNSCLESKAQNRLNRVKVLALQEKCF